MPRYRLRFVLQEFDLPRGVTVIGRGLDCQLTIEDPLVSRRHARIIVADTGAQIEDLGSRNGVRVNGASIRQPTMLRNGDRLRLGTQELLFTRVDDAGRGHTRTTGQLRLCASCRQPYPREMLACPSCEATEQMDDETLTANDAAASHHWSMQLFVEALERALRLGRIEDAERLIRRATTQVDELVASGTGVDRVALCALGVQAATTALATGEPAWAEWVLEIYGRCGFVPPMRVIARLAEVADVHPRLRAGIRGFTDRLRAADAAALLQPAGAVMQGEEPEDGLALALTALARIAEGAEAEPLLGSVQPPDWR